MELVELLGTDKNKPRLAQVIRLVDRGAIIRVGNREVQASLFASDVKPGMRVMVLVQDGDHMIIATGPMNNEKRNVRIIDG